MLAAPCVLLCVQGRQDLLEGLGSAKKSKDAKDRVVRESLRAKRVH